jgi:hypothetical protein
MNTGIQSAAGVPITAPLPLSWLGRADAPAIPPIWASIGAFSVLQLRNLQAQIAYDLSTWNYTKIGTNNKLGRYQFSTQTLETYGLLAAGSNVAYGTDCVNYVHSWSPAFVNNGVNDYANYFYNINSLNEFFINTSAQEHLAYRQIADLYTECMNIGVIQSGDSIDSIAGLIYVAWTLGTGTGPTIANPNGTGAWAWRYNNIGAGINSYNSGRYAIVVLSQ